MHMMAKLAAEPASPYIQQPARRQKQVHAKTDKTEQPQYTTEPASTSSKPFSSYEEAFSSAMATTVLFKNRASQTLSGMAQPTPGTAGGFASVKEEAPSRHGYMKVMLRSPDKPKAANSRPLSIAPSSSVMSRNVQLLKSYAAPAPPLQKQPQAPSPAPLVTPVSSQLQTSALPLSSSLKAGVLGTNQSGAPAYTSTHSNGQALTQVSAGGSEQSVEEMHTGAAGSTDSSMGGATTQVQATQGLVLACASESKLSQGVAAEPADSSAVLPYGAVTSSHQEQRAELASRLSRASNIYAATSPASGDAAAHHKQADGALLQLWTMECIDAVRSHKAQKHLRQMLHTNAVPTLTPLPLTPTSPRGTKKCHIASNKHRQLRVASAGELMDQTTDTNAALQHVQSSCTGRPLRASSPGPLRASSPSPLKGTPSSTPPHQLMLQRQSVDSALKSSNAASAKDQLLLQRGSVDSALKVADTAAGRASSPDPTLHGKMHVNKTVSSGANQATPYGSAQRRRQYHNQVVQARGYVGGLDLPGERFLSGLEGLTKEAVKTTVLQPPVSSKSAAASGPSPTLAQAAATTPAPFLMGIAVDQLEEIHHSPDTALPSISEMVSSQIWHPPADQLSKSGKHSSAYQFADLMKLQGPSKEAFLAAACASEPGPSVCGSTWDGVNDSPASSGLCGIGIHKRSGGLSVTSFAAQRATRDATNGTFSRTRSPSPSMCDSHSLGTRLRTAYSSQGGRPYRQSQLQSELSQYSQLLCSAPEMNLGHTHKVDGAQPSALHEAWAVVEDDMQAWADKIPATYSGRIPSVTAASVSTSDAHQLSPRSRSTSPQHRHRSTVDITLTSVPTPDPACADLHRAHFTQTAVSGRGGSIALEKEKSMASSGKQQTNFQLARSGKDLLALSGSTRPNTVMSLSRCTTATAGKLVDTREALRKAPAGSGALGKGWAARLGPEGSLYSGHMSLGRSKRHLSAAPSAQSIPAFPDSDIAVHDMMDHGVVLQPSVFDSQMEGTVPQAGQSYGLEHEDSVDST